MSDESALPGPPQPLPPKPAAREGRVRLWQYARAFRQDILSAQPARLYRAWMAEFRTPFFRSFLVNDPALVRRVLSDEPGRFPKSDRVSEGLRPLLGRSVFVTNGNEWERQRRIIDPAFAGGRLRDSWPAMVAAAEAAARRIGARSGEVIDVEREASHAAADVIFRTLFSIPIEHRIARQVFDEFRRYQRSQPILNVAALLRLPRVLPRPFRREIRTAARTIRQLVAELVDSRLTEIAAGRAPDDLATRILTTADPVTGERFDRDEMVDQVAIFFLAGHETSASALAWALYLVAEYPRWQEAVASEAQGIDLTVFSGLSRLRVARDVFRETLRLYPPVPMMVREAACPARFRDRDVRRGDQIVLSPWHLHRHERLWPAPDAFAPERWSSEEGRSPARDAYIPFSAGPRVCVGAGFAMAEGTLMLAALLRDLKFAPAGPRPVPVAHLTVRAREGIRLEVRRRTMLGPGRAIR